MSPANSHPEIRRALRPTIRLAWPVIMAELGWMFMGVVDTIMVGWLAPQAIGAVGLGGIVFFTVAVFGMGLLLGLDTFVSQAYGAGNLHECHRWLRAGVHLACVATLPVMLIAFGLVAAMPLFKWHPMVQRLTAPYLSTLAWGALPLLLYASFRRYLQALGIVRPVMITLLAANVVNALFNWLLIFGHLGFPALGVNGSAWATVIARVFMASCLLAVIVRHERVNRLGLSDVSFRQIEWDRVWRLLRLGAPAATQITAEVGIFGAVAALAGRIDPVSLAGHQVALNIASVTFMVPLGLASAGAVRVGHAVGRRDSPDAAAAGWAAIVIGATFMTVAAIVFLAAPGGLAALFTRDGAVIATSITLLRIAAAFQLFDGIQVVTTGALRGLGDTRTAMLANLVGHWLIGLPLAALMAFGLGWGVVGLWAGLSIGLTLVGVVLIGVWKKRLMELSARLEGSIAATLTPRPELP
jgi:multidrug resistance protein, MATE family